MIYGGNTMALIHCMECDKEISDKSESCPNCGCPTSLTIEAINKAKLMEENKDKMFYTCPVCHKDYEKGTMACTLCGYEAIPSKTKPQPPKTNPNQVKCPFCGSPDVRKITQFNRAMGSLFFGFNSPNHGKQWNCRNCDSFF